MSLLGQKLPVVPTSFRVGKTRAFMATFSILQDVALHSISNHLFSSLSFAHTTPNTEAAL